MSSQKHKQLTPLENPVQLAVIGAAHGIRGEVRVKTYTGDPLDLGSYGLLYDAAGKAYDVLTVRPSKTVVVVRFRGVDDRNAAEALNGTELFVEHSQLPQKLDEDEFYYTDLIGLEVRDAEAKTYGTVSAVFNFGGGDVLEIKETSKKPVLIPFTKISVPEIEMEQGYILIDPLAAGLLTSDEDEASDRAAQMAAEQNDAEQNSAGKKADDDGWVR